MSRMSSTARTAEVTCPAGTVIGVRDGACNHFRSVPYARVARPFDDPVAPARGMLIRATTDASAAPALSITTPAGARAMADLPVMVWIHGGRFEEGSHTELVSNPAGVAAAGVVHVRVGYRLKFPGMLPVTADAPGHYRAAADCAAALTWIQRNIEAFGGDPTNVTVVGQSAGGALALWLTRRDHYRGEFRRALAISPAFPRRGFESRNSHRCPPWSRTRTASFSGRALLFDAPVSASPMPPCAAPHGRGGLGTLRRWWPRAAPRPRGLGI